VIERSQRGTTLLRDLFLAALCALPACTVASVEDDAPNGSVELLNASYDPTRELYAEVNQAFGAKWRAEHGQRLTIKQSHGGSGKQARAVSEGLYADVVTLALAYDIDAIAAQSGLVSADWRTELPHRGVPLWSTVVFLVRKGNPKQIRDWEDLTRPDIEVVTPNPKTSGGGRLNYLAAYGAALMRSEGDHTRAEAFVRRLYGQVRVLDSGARGATTTFVERELGDVLLTWENEALLAARRLRAAKVDVVVPALSIRAEPPVALVSGVTRRRGSDALARAYLEFLYTDEGQRIGMRHYFRPQHTALLASRADLFPPLELFTVDERFGGWSSAHRQHFGDGGSFDRIAPSLGRGVRR